VISRLNRYGEVISQEPELGYFLDGEFGPILARVLERSRSKIAICLGGSAETINDESRTLSPSDFVFHNALRRPDGGLTFLDFEYFGWDDPVKTISDFLHHPAMMLTKNQRSRFLTGAVDVYGESIVARLDALYPLWGLKWCLIMLNEYLGSEAERRQFAGIDVKSFRLDQLEKARGLLKSIGERLDASSLEGLIL